jgi:hypothetical protein
MSLSHHLWRSPHGTPVIADSARKPTKYDGFRVESMIMHPWRRTGHYPQGQGVDEFGPPEGVPRNAVGGGVEQDWFRWRAVPGSDRTASAA